MVIPINHASDLTDGDNKHHLAVGAKGDIIISTGSKWVSGQPSLLGFGYFDIDLSRGIFDGCLTTSGSLSGREYSTPEYTLSWEEETSGSCGDGSGIWWRLRHSIVIKYYSIYKCERFRINTYLVGGSTYLIDDIGNDVSRSGSPGWVFPAMENTSGSDGFILSIYGDDTRSAFYSGSGILAGDLLQSTPNRTYVTNIGLIYSPLDAIYYSEPYPLANSGSGGGYVFFFDSSGSVGSYVSVSSDGGETWGAFEPCLNGSLIPGLSPGQDLTDIWIKVKFILYCEPITCIMGVVSNPKFIQIEGHVYQHVNDGEDLFCIVGPDEPTETFPGMIWWDTDA
jgi:hypothetical protein